MKRLIPALAFGVFAIGPLFSLAQMAKLNSSCDLAMFDANDTKSFLAFDAQPFSVSMVGTRDGRRREYSRYRV
jgi:hypothetical protein